MKKLLVIGSINMDMTTFAGRYPKAGETISGQGFLLSPGGKGANQAVAAARMGAATRMCGCVGEDAFGPVLIRGLETSGVDASPVRMLEGVSTGVAAITVCDGDNRIILFDGANARVADISRDDLRALIEDCDALLLQLEVPMEAVLTAIELAHELGKLVFLTPAPARELPDWVFRKVTHLIPNESEAALLLGRPLESDQDMLDALTAFLELGVKCPLITLGERGVGCVIDGRPQIVKGYKVRPVDTTAAGDTFTGALAAATLRGEPLDRAVDFAQTAAAICVTRKGAQNAIPSLEEVRSARLERS